MAIIKHGRGRYPTIIRWVVGTPLVWSIIIPVIISDVFLEVYHRVAFPVYGIAHLERRGYVQSEHEKSFAKYGDEAALKRRYANHERDYGTEIR